MDHGNENFIFKLFTGHAKPSGHGLQRIIYYIHVSWEIKSANHASRKYPCTTLTLRTDIKGRKGYVKKCHAEGRTIAQLGAAMGQRKVIPTILLHFFPFVQQFQRNWTKRFSDHTVINLKRKLQIFCYKIF